MAALTDPIRRLTSELVWLREEFHLASKPPRARQKQLAGEMAIIRIHDAWARYCRELVILSASGNTVTLNGIVVPAVVKRRSDVIPILLATYRKRRYAPKWARATECIEAASRLKIANIGTVAAALGATNSPADEIRHIRNYYAHRRHGAAIRAIACGVFVGTSPVVFDLDGYKNAGETFLESWVNGLLLVAIAASQ
jgi:hypothetical protein